MKVLVVGLNYAPEPVGIGPYTTGMAEALVRMGHQVAVVAAKPYYPEWKVPADFRGRSYCSSVEQGVEIVRCPIYVPAEPSGAKRLVHYASFAATALPVALRVARKLRPDIVVAIAPSLISATVARAAAKLNGARLWLHVQDFEVEAAFATGLLNESGAAATAARKFEDWSLAADRVSSISPQMCAKLVEKGVPAERVVEFRNWASTDQVRPIAAESPFRARWDITRPHVALYSGNIARKQGIEIITQAAELLRHRKDLLFVVCGNGANRERLIASAAHLDNIRFFDLQPMEHLSDLLGLATVHLLPQIAGAADLVLPSKLTNMLASGRAVIATADAGTGLAREMAGCGVAVPAGDTRAFAGAIEELIDDAPLRAAYGAVARQRAEERWSKTSILRRFEGELHTLLKDGEARPGSTQDVEVVP